MNEEIIKIMTDRFSKDSLISVATIYENKPYVRVVDAYFEDGSFYIITHNKSNKMKQITINPYVAICGEWMTGHGIAENLGYVLDNKNIKITNKLREVFSSWIDNDHNDFNDINTIILKIEVTECKIMANEKSYTYKKTL